VRDAVTVSVVIPTRNRPDILAARALRTALAQEGVAIEVLIVDDGSEPPVQVAIETRVSVLRHTASRGVAAARNSGLLAARGEWVAFLDDDDLWSPFKLRKQLAALERGGDFCYAGAIVLDTALRPLRLVPPPSASGLLGELLNRNVMPAGASNVIVRRAALIGIGGFDESFSHLDDWDCWLRLAATNVARPCDEVLVGNVLHSGSRVQREYDVQDGELARLERKHEALANRLGTSFDRHDFARYVAVGHRRAGRAEAAARSYLESARRHRSVGDIARAAAAVARVPPRRQRRVKSPDWVGLYR
jgi:glycosyltransferase involved in cell wall biosynthesis